MAGLFDKQKTGMQIAQAAPTGNVADTGGTRLSAGEETVFQDWIKSSDWYKEFKGEYGEEPDIRPPSTNPRHGPNYDYRGAWKAGIAPRADEHDPSPKTGKPRLHWPDFSRGGQQLKTSTHPTLWKGEFEKETGINPDSLGMSKDEAAEYLRIKRKR